MQDRLTCFSFCLFPSLSLFQATFLFSLIKYTPLTYNKKYTYPWWGDALGWLLALSSMVCIPAWSAYKLSHLKGPFREVQGGMEASRGAKNPVEGQARAGVWER